MSSTGRATTCATPARCARHRSPYVSSTATSAPSWRPPTVGGPTRSSTCAPGYRPARVAELVRFARPADRRRRARHAARRARAGAGRRSRAGRRCSSSGRSGPGCWPAGCSRCARPRTRRWSPTSPSCARSPRPARRDAVVAGARGRAAAARARAGMAAPGLRRGRRPGHARRAAAALADDTALVAYVVTADRGGRPGGHHRTARPGSTSVTATSSTPCSAGCCPTSTWPRPTSRTRWAPSCAPSSPTGWARSPACWSRPCWTPSATAASCSPRPACCPGCRGRCCPGYVGRPVTLAQSATAWLARRTSPLRTATAGFVAGPRVARAEDEVVAAAKEWP